MGNAYTQSVDQSPTPPPTHLQDSQPGVFKYYSNKNPGTIEQLHKECKGVFPAVFEGAKLEVITVFKNNFEINLTHTMSSIIPDSYRFGGTYIGTNQVSPTESFPVFTGDMDPNGNLTSNIIHQYKNIRARFASWIQDHQFVATQLTTDVKGLDYTASVTLNNIDILNGSGLTYLHYLQNVAPSIDLGAEMGYQCGPQIPGGEIAATSLAGRYTGEKYIVSGNLGTAALRACFYYKEDENVQFGLDVNANFGFHTCVAAFGFQVDLPERYFVFRGMVDSDWTVGAVLEKKLPPLPFTLALSGMINHTTGQRRFGIGLLSSTI